MVIKLDVQKDGSCLFWSVALAYLIPVKDDDALFQGRYEILFGNEQDVIQNLDHIKNLVRGFNVDNRFANLVRNTFRTRVVDHISSHKNEFRDFVEGDFDSYLTKMKDPNTWGDQPEIRAMSEMLKAHINVSGSSKSEYKYGNIPIKLFHVGPIGSENHYNFGLEQDMISDDQARQWIWS